MIDIAEKKYMEIYFLIGMCNALAPNYHNSNTLSLYNYVNMKHNLKIDHSGS